MASQFNITGFVIASIIVHALFLFQFQIKDYAISFNDLNNTKNNFSSTVLRITFSSHSDSISNVSDIAQRGLRKEPIPQRAETKRNIDKKYTVPEKTETKANVNQLKNVLENSVQTHHIIKNIDAAVSTKKDRYLKNIFNKIEGNKFYPNSARKRNIQESIPVTFTLLRSGDATDIKVLGKYKILRYAAKQSILNSLPFDMPPESMSLPYIVSYSMAFSITN